MQIPVVDYINHFPAFTGHVNLARYLALYETFKMIEGVNGHYADVGTWKGASFLFVAKLIRLFEPYSMSQIHAFDWFQGMNNKQVGVSNDYIGSEENLKALVDAQGLSDVAVIHKLDLVNELGCLADDPVYAPIYYKYVFLDCGNREVLEKAIPFFWGRLVNGGVMVFDHFGTDCKDETDLAREFLPKGTVVKTFPFARQPTGYVLKN